MFTVKLIRGHITKIVQAEQVDIYPSGPMASDCPPDPKDRTTDVLELALKAGSHYAAFYVTDTSKPRPQGWADHFEFFDVAYIENERGATTEVVRPY